MLVSQGFILFSLPSDPVLGYAPMIWDSYTTKNIKKPEIIQRRADRFTLGLYYRKASVTSILSDKLKWPSLQQRRKKRRRTTMYKKMFGKIDKAKASA